MIDTETTGLGPDREVIEVAVVDPEGRVEFEALIRPEQPLEAGAVVVHGLNADALAAEPPFPEVLPALLEHIEGRPLLAYNAPFDRLSLLLTAHRHGLCLPPLSWDCLLERCAELHGFRMSLRTACELTGIPITAGPHRAAGDALLAWKLIRALGALPG